MIAGGYPPPPALSDSPGTPVFPDFFSLVRFSSPPSECCSLLSGYLELAMPLLASAVIMIQGIPYQIHA